MLTGQLEVAVSHDAWKRALVESLDATDRATIQRKLAALGVGSLRPPLSVAYHLQGAGEHQQALHMLAELPMEAEPLNTFGQLQLSLQQMSAKRALTRRWSARSYSARSY